MQHLLNFLFFVFHQIKRPYFHVKPLERCQLKNWHDYLDFEIMQGDQARIIVLFERCLIACALYEEFWLKVSLIYLLFSKTKIFFHSSLYITSTN